MTSPAPDELLLVGQITAPFGVQGQLKVRAITDKPEHLQRRVHTVYVGAPPRAFTLRRSAIHKPGVLIFTLAEVASREDAEALRNAEVFIREADAAPLDAEEYYIHQLFGLAVLTEDGSTLGQVREVLETGANEVLVVARRGQSDALIPMIHDVVQQIDVPGGKIVVRLIPGLLGDE
ncbi:MAG: 16S rRNA processing protein RimM [Chloroflexales bacterium]|nr:16S rRNA processing protein RimM [Chloroflexales bacterium]